MRTTAFHAGGSRRRWFFLLICALALICGGCANFNTTQGVGSPWEQGEAPRWDVGTTKQSDVLDRLGPPSQIIALNGGSVFYYLRERGQGSAKIFIIYNQGEMTVEYDRAIFFFDADGVLTDFSYSDDPSPEAVTD